MYALTADAATFHLADATTGHGGLPITLAPHTVGVALASPPGSPGTLAPVVEVVAGGRTLPATTRLAGHWVLTLGLTPAPARDAPSGPVLCLTW